MGFAQHGHSQSLFLYTQMTTNGQSNVYRCLGRPYAVTLYCLQFTYAVFTILRRYVSKVWDDSIYWWHNLLGVAEANLTVILGNHVV